LKTGRQKKNRITRHARIKRNSSVKRRISELRSDWDALDPITRGERLRKLIALGCSGRGLAEELRVSPTNIRFHLDLAEITPTEKLAVKAGASAKQAFETLQQRREVEARLERVRLEQETSAVSNQLAKDIVAFCQTRHIWKQDPDDPVKKIVFGEDLTEQFFAELNGNIEMRVRGLLPKPHPAALQTEFCAICHALQPDQRHYDFWLSWLVDWLAVAVMAGAPEAPIRDAALKKAASLLSQSFAALGTPIRYFTRQRPAIYRR
jgi:hypothetical protein